MIYVKHQRDQNCKIENIIKKSKVLKFKNPHESIFLYYLRCWCLPWWCDAVAEGVGVVSLLNFNF